MREYLALHNVSLLTFWVFVFLWFLGVVVCWVLVKMWFINMKKYKGDSMPNALFTLTVLVVLAGLLPVLASIRAIKDPTSGMNPVSVGQFRSGCVAI